MEIIAGRFRVHKWLGEGSLGDLYLVQQEGAELRNTLRVLPPAAPDGQAPAALVTDIPRIRHPNIAQVLEVGETAEGLTYVVMDHAGGTLLAEVVAEGGLREVRRTSFAPEARTTMKD